MRFFITNTGEDHFVLGYPFLSTFNPQVDWSKGQISGPTANVLTIEFKQAQKQLRRVQLQAIRTCTRQPKTGEAIYYRRVMTTQDTHNWRERQATTKELLEKYHGVLYKERQPLQKSARNKGNTLHSRIHGAMTCRNARSPMDKGMSKPNGNWKHRNTRTTREDQCKITTGIYTPPMMRPRSTGALLHQKKLEPYQSNPKWVRNEEGRYEKARIPNVMNADTTDVEVSTTETIRPKICCCISKNQHFLFHLIQSYYILFL